MTTKNKNPFRLVRNHKFFGLLILLILSVAVFWSVRTYQKHQNKVAFQQARAAIDEIYADIVAKVGQPADSRNENECSRPNQEFTQGPLSCAVGTSFIYAVGDRDEAIQKYKDIQSVIKSRPDLLKPDGPWSTAIGDELVVNTYYHSALDKFKTLSGMQCFNKYVYDTPREMDLTTNSDHSLQIYMDCSEFARQQLYPLHRL
jgi:cbb3-type cytochrome oxidase subunit 3